ncbi:hypothetical protein A9X04_08770 [Mycobacterium sp. E3247]|nr:hypothetical protein A9X04_08770 [Mycobacterium sp. E3247]
MLNELLTDGDRRPCGFMMHRSDGGQSSERARAVRESKRRQKGDSRDRRPAQSSKSIQPHDLEIPRSEAHAAQDSTGAGGRGRVRVSAE